MLLVLSSSRKLGKLSTSLVGCDWCSSRVKASRGQSWHSLSKRSSYVGSKSSLTVSLGVQWYPILCGRLEGINMQSNPQWASPFHDETAKIDDTFLVGKVSLPRSTHLLSTSVLSKAVWVMRQTAVANSSLSLSTSLLDGTLFMNREQTDKYYANDQELLEDIILRSVRWVIAYAAGCSHQLMTFSWGVLVHAVFLAPTRRVLRRLHCRD